MSQAGSISISSSPSVPTTFTTDDGTATPAANNINILADDTTDNNNNGLATSGSGDTVTILLTNRFQATGTADNGATADLVTFDLGASAAVYRVEFKVAGRETTTGDGAGYTLFACFKTDGASASIVDNQFKDADEDTALEAGDMNLIASGNNMILRATGVAALTINYSAVGYYVVV